MTFADGLIPSSTSTPKILLSALVRQYSEACAVPLTVFHVHRVIEFNVASPYSQSLHLCDLKPATDMRRAQALESQLSFESLPQSLVVSDIPWSHNTKDCAVGDVRSIRCCEVHAFDFDIISRTIMAGP